MVAENLPTLTVARKALATDVGALPYVPTVIDPPCVVVEPGDPYITFANATRQGLVLTARCDVYVLVPEDDNERMADDLDAALLATYADIESGDLWAVETVGRPGTHFTADWQAYGVKITAATRVLST